MRASPFHAFRDASLSAPLLALACVAIVATVGFAGPPVTYSSEEPLAFDDSELSATGSPAWLPPEAVAGPGDPASGTTDSIIAEVPSQSEIPATAGVPDAVSDLPSPDDAPQSQTGTPAPPSAGTGPGTQPPPAGGTGSQNASPTASSSSTNRVCCSPASRMRAR